MHEEHWLHKDNYIICDKCKTKRNAEVEYCVICEDIEIKERLSKTPEHIKRVEINKKYYQVFKENKLKNI